MAWLLDSVVLLLSFSSRKCRVLVLPNFCHGFSVDAVISRWLGVSRTINEHLAWSWAWQEQECSPQIHIPSAPLRFQALMYLGGTMWLVLTNGLWPAVMCIIFETKHLIADARSPQCPLLCHSDQDNLIIQAGTKLWSLHQPESWVKKSPLPKSSTRENKLLLC